MYVVSELQYWIMICSLFGDSNMNLSIPLFQGISAEYHTKAKLIPQVKGNCRNGPFSITKEK